MNLKSIFWREIQIFQICTIFGYLNETFWRPFQTLLAIFFTYVFKANEEQEC